MTSTLLQLPRLNAPRLHQLANGLVIVAEQMPVAAVNLSLWIKVGSAIEADSINGMAHFLEHMIFKGTEQLSNGEFERRVEERGAITNAATSQDYTHYYITCAPKDFAELCPLQIDIVMGCLIPEVAFERERLVVLEEIRRFEDNPRRRTFQQAMQLAFDYLPYRRSVLGPASVISQLQPEQMREFHATWYQPSNITAVVVGNLPVEQLIQVVTDGFAKQSRERRFFGANATISNLPTQMQVSSFLPELPFTTIVRREFVDDTLQQARLVIVWRVPGLIQISQTYALDVLAAILGQGRTSRLVRHLREEKGLVSHISISNITYKWQGTFYISAVLPVENLAIVEAEIVQHIHNIQIEPVKQVELDRVRTQVANRFIFGNETPSDRSNLYGYYQSMLAELQPVFNYPATIQALTADDLMQSAQRYLSPTAYGILTAKPRET